MATLVAAGTGLWLQAAAQVPSNFNDGRWQVTVETEIRGMSVKPPPLYEYTRCFTAADFQPNLAPAHAPCRAIEVEVSSDVMSWRLTCEQSAGEMKGRGRMKFGGNKVEGVVITTSEYPEPMQVIQTIKARRIGRCIASTTPLPAPPRRQLPDYVEGR
jgi:hypothetical protein